MANALREIIARFGVSVDDKPLQGLSSSIDGVVGQLKGLAGFLTGGLLAGGLFHFITGLTEEADALVKQARALGLSNQALQEWNYVAGLGGASSEALAGALAKISAGKFDKGLQELGVKTKDAAGQMRDSGDVLEDIADKLKGIQNPAERNRKAVQVLGKSYTQLLPVLEGGSEGIRELRKEFHELGGGFDDDFAKNAEEFNDNLSRLKTAGKSLAITLLSAILPTLLHMTQRLVQLAKPMLVTLKNSNALRAAMGLLAVKGLLVASKAIGPLGGAFRTLLTRMLPIILAFLLLEDAMGFLEGKDSLIGRALDGIFGEGTQEKVRKWINDVIKDFKSFVREIRDAPGKIADDWELFTSTLAKDMRGTFGEFGDVLNAAGALFLWFIDLATGGWDNFIAKMGAGIDGYLLALKVFWLEMMTGFAMVTAHIENLFASMWNGIVERAQMAIRTMATVAGVLPGGAGDKLRDVAKTLDSAKAGDAVARVNAARDAERGALTSEFDAIGARLGQGVRPAVHNEVNVTVPPGTPEQVANRVASAAQKGVQKGNSATRAALTGGG